ncbi:MAG: ATP-binding protein, partial [Treponema sp.]|nr:ATP-binding protein [Treponema sp.]
APPVGVCGSGLVDAVAVMLKRGIIDETGFMADGEKGFCLAPGVSITGRDIRQFQLAKSAIYSGIRILCKNSGLNAADIGNVFIAGGFGFYVNKINAIIAGLFPPEMRNSLSICGNLSLQGAQECLTAPDFVSRCKHTAARCSVIDLAADPSFTDEFAANMLFPAI